MDQKQILERWLKQLKNDEISPDAIGLGPDKEEAIHHIMKELTKIDQLQKQQPPSSS